MNSNYCSCGKIRRRQLRLQQHPTGSAPRADRRRHATRRTIAGGIGSACQSGANISADKVTKLPTEACQLASVGAPKLTPERLAAISNAAQIDWSKRNGRADELLQAEHDRTSSRRKHPGNFNVQ